MELIDYVTNTPQNTNRTILKQLVNSEKNKAVYESVEELKRDGGVGWDEKLVFTYDGNMDGKEIFDGGGPMKGVRVGDIIDLHSIKKVVGILSGQKTEISAEEIEVTNVMDGMDAAAWNGTAMVIAMQANNEFGCSAGTYVVHLDDQTYVEYVETDIDIAHPIAPKYLPGVCLPMVDLVGLEPSAENPVPEEIANVVKTASANALPIIVHANSVFNNTPVVKSLVAEFIDFGEGDFCGYIWEERYNIGIIPYDGEVYFMDMTGGGRMNYLYNGVKLPE